MPRATSRTGPHNVSASNPDLASLIDEVMRAGRGRSRRGGSAVSQDAAPTSQGASAVARRAPSLDLCEYTSFQLRPALRARKYADA